MSTMYTLVVNNTDETIVEDEFDNITERNEVLEDLLDQILRNNNKTFPTIDYSQFDNDDDGPQQYGLWLERLAKNEKLGLEILCNTVTVIDPEEPASHWPHHINLYHLIIDTSNNDKVRVHANTLSQTGESVWIYTFTDEDTRHKFLQDYIKDLDADRATSMKSDDLNINNIIQYLEDVYGFSVMLLDAERENDQEPWSCIA